MPSTTDPIVSTGRGGAGNIGRDPTVYTDGEIVRENIQGQPERPGQDYSTGRGGAGNIGSPRLNPVHSTGTPKSSSSTPTPTATGALPATAASTGTKTAAPARGLAATATANAAHGTATTGGRGTGQDVVPEPALRQPGAGYENYHTGRGGEGNVHREKYGGHSSPQEATVADGEKHKEGLGEKVKNLFHKKD